MNESKNQAESDAFYPIDFCIVSGNDFDEEGSGMIPLHVCTRRNLPQILL